MKRFHAEEREVLLRNGLPVEEFSNEAIVDDNFIMPRYSIAIVATQ